MLDNREFFVATTGGRESQGSFERMFARGGSPTCSMIEQDRVPWIPKAGYPTDLASRRCGLFMR